MMRPRANQVPTHILAQLARAIRKQNAVLRDVVQNPRLSELMNPAAARLATVHKTAL
jgi:hypothetical protein